MKVKYLQVKDHLLELIRAGGEGDLLPSEAELCRQFNVSRITSRKALQALEDEALIERKKGRGTFIKSISSYFAGVKRLLLVCDVSGNGPLSSFLQRILEGCYSEIGRGDCVLSLAPSNIGRRDLIDLAERLEVHGIIGMAPYAHLNEILEELRLRRYPILVVNRVVRNSHLSYVSTDHLACGWDATRFLLDRGHRRIAFSTLFEGVSYSQQQYEGYQRAMRQAGATPREMPTVKLALDGAPEQIETIFERRLKRMFETHRPTAIVLEPGRYMPVFLRVVRESGLGIGTDIELVARDVSTTLGHFPERDRIHDLRQPFFALGAEAVRQMNRLVESQTSRVTLTLPAELSPSDQSKPLSSQGGQYEAA